MRPTLTAALCAAFFAIVADPAAAHNGVIIHDPYARVIAGSGVVFFLIENHEDDPDTLVGAATDAAGMAMLMNDTANADGVMQMREVPQGFTVDALGQRLLTNVADHVMLTDLKQKLKKGDTFTLTLTFRNAGDVVVTVPVDNLRTSDPGLAPTPYDAESGDADGTVHSTRDHDMTGMDMGAKAP